jgi:hypothetical protein
MTRRARPTETHRETVDEESEMYSLWTAPPNSWRSPVNLDCVPAELEARVSELKQSSAEEDERTKAFGTPVTPEVLSQPTEA